MARALVRSFATVNPLYRRATAHFYEVDSNGNLTTTPITLYLDEDGQIVAKNPVTLDGQGKTPQPIYFDAAHWVKIEGLADADHSTGVFRPSDVTWGLITGNLADQSDLSAVLDAIAKNIQSFVKDQANTFDVGAIRKHLRTEADWSGSFTHSFTGTPLSGLQFWVYNNSGFTQQISGSAISVGTSPYPLADQQAILLVEQGGVMVDAAIAGGGSGGGGDVTSVNGETGAVVLDALEINTTGAFTPTRWTPADDAIQSHFAGIDSKLGNIGVADLGGFSGTKSASTFARGDGTFATPEGGGDMLAATYDPNADGLFATAVFGDNQVTYAKIQDVSAASRIIGRGSAAGAGDPQELTAASGLEVSGTAVQIAAGGLASSHFGTGVVLTAAVGDDQITYGKMQDTSAASRVLGRGSAAGAGTVEELTAANGVEISGTAIQLADNGVTLAKLATLTADRLVGSDGSGDPIEVTMGTGMSLSNGVLSAITSEANALAIDVRNETGGVLAKGTPVYINGFSGSFPTVAAAQANTPSTMPAIGVIQSDLADLSNGKIIAEGRLTVLNTSSFSDGDKLYVGNAGGLTNTAPSGTSKVQHIAVCLRSDATNGEISLDPSRVAGGGDAVLEGIADLGTAGDKAIYFSGAQTPAEFDLTAFARTLLDDPNDVTARATLGLVIGTDVQAPLPVSDTTAIVKGSVDATKLWRVEVDGFTAGTTRVLTPADRNWAPTVYGEELTEVADAAAGRTTLDAAKALHVHGIDSRLFGDLTALWSGRFSTITETSGRVSTLGDVTPAGRNLAEVSTSGPTYVADSGNGEPAIDFDGVANYLQSAVALSVFIGAADFYVRVRFRADAVAAKAGATYNNPAIISDAGEFFGLHIYNDGQDDVLAGYIWDAGEKTVTVPIVSGQVHYAEFWHDGTNINLRVDNGDPATLAAGSITTVTNVVNVGSDSDATAFLDFALFDLDLANGQPRVLLVGVADDNLVEVDDAGGLVSGEYLRATANGVESRSTSQARTDLDAAQTSHTHPLSDVTDSGAHAAFETASQAQAEAGLNNSTGMTPLRTKQAIGALGAPAFTAVDDPGDYSGTSFKVGLTGASKNEQRRFTGNQNHLLDFVAANLSDGDFGWLIKGGTGTVTLVYNDISLNGGVANIVLHRTVKWTVHDGEVLIDGGTDEPVDMKGVQIVDAELKDYAETSTAPTPSGGAVTLDLTVGNCFDVTLNAATVTFTFSNPPASPNVGTIFLIIRQDATGGRAAAWPASVVWGGGTAPTLSSGASEYDTLSFITNDGGTTWLGHIGDQNFS